MELILRKLFFDKVDIYQRVRMMRMLVRPSHPLFPAQDLSLSKSKAEQHLVQP